MEDLRAVLETHLSGTHRVVRQLGSGGMATVFLVTDAKHDRQVALKVLRPEVAGAVGAGRFLREIETAARLTHPHLLPLHDSGQIGDLLYYSMPFVDGESLRSRIDREGALPIADAVSIATECADGLSYAHEHGIIHRDVKPGNILLSAGHAVLADFGIARALEEAAEPSLTTQGVAVGTVGYMSPEQATGEGAVDERSDVYALGCVLYEMLTGERPFAGRSRVATSSKEVPSASGTVTVTGLASASASTPAGPDHSTESPGCVVRSMRTPYLPLRTASRVNWDWGSAKIVPGRTITTSTSGGGGGSGPQFPQPAVVRAARQPRIFLRRFEQDMDAP
jgi:serine/threonine-protein kinase